MLAIVVVLALLAGVVSEVTAHSASTYNNETDAAVGAGNGTGDSAAGNDSDDSHGSTSNGTYGLASVDGNATALAEGGPGSGTDVGALGATVEDSAEIERLLSKASRMELVFDGTESAVDGLSENEQDEGSGDETPTDSGGNEFTPRHLDLGPATGEWDDSGTGSDSAGSTLRGPSAAAAGASSTGGDSSMPLTGLAVGVQAVVAGVAFRELTDVPAPARTVAVTGRQVMDRGPRLFAPLRYSRYDDSDPLEHDDRAAVFETIEDSPGVYLSQLSERTEVSLSTLRHHVRVLEREDLIAAARVRGRRRFYPAHTEDVELAAAMNDEATAPIVDALARLGAVTVSDLADADGRDASTVTHHLQRLEEDGLVERERDGRAIVNRLAAEVREALAPMGDTAPEPVESEATVSAD